MFELAVPEGVHDNRVIDYLKNQKEFQEGEHFIRTPDEFGFVNYTFPGMDEDNFRYIATQLKRNGVNLDLVDTQLTERKIMKLIDLIEAPLENFNEDEISEKDVISQIKEILASDEADPTSKFWSQIADCIGEYEDQDKPKNAFYESKKDKVRKVIRKLIRQ